MAVITGFERLGITGGKCDRQGSKAIRMMPACWLDFLIRHRDKLRRIQLHQPFRFVCVARERWRSGM